MASGGGVLIRRERPEDGPPIGDVHTEAFATFYPDRDPPEPRLVEQLRCSAAWLEPLSLVAVVDDAVVGHVCCTRATLLPRGDAVLGLGPIGVRTHLHRRGFGTALMHAVIAAADALDEPLIGVLGRPEYYRRFGFRPAAELGVEPEEPAWEPAFQVRTLSAHRPDQRGRFSYAAPFGQFS